jgi:dolichol-phosphate mannosyltransferase
MSNGRVMLSLVVPTYNERDNLPRLAKRIHDSIGSRCRYEMMVVDDNSPDETWKVARDLSKRYPIRVIRRRSKLGLASAVVEGFRRARGELLSVIDADLQHPPEMLPRLLDEIEKGKDLVIASRYVKDGDVGFLNSRRRVISKGATFLARSFVPEISNVEDPLSGFFMVRREVIRGVELKPVGYKILFEILAKGHYRNVSEIPFTFGIRETGKSKLTMTEYANFVRDLLRVSWIAEGTVRVAGYAATGLLSFFANMFFFILMTAGLHLNYFFSAVLSVEAMILINLALNGRWIFSRWRTKRLSTRVPKFIEYNAFCLGGLAINIIVLWAFTDLLNVYYFASNLVGALGAVLWNQGIIFRLTARPS